MKEELNSEEKNLEALKGKNPFNVPVNYFEELPGKVIHQINSLPLSNTSSATNPFSVPDGYFEVLKASIQSKINKNKSTGWVQSLLRPRVAIPLSMAVIVVALIFLFSNKISKDTTPQEICADDLNNSSYIQSMDEYMLIDYLAEQKENLTDQGIEQYLIDNDIDITEIENEL